MSGFHDPDGLELEMAPTAVPGTYLFRHTIAAEHERNVRVLADLLGVERAPFTVDDVRWLLDQLELVAG